ncbi:MAG TPA: hypothetical protein VJY35_02675 [Candidatus Eisenbacteria bacterium]|nr:hypothetical protein [Candidatus Eisenbacteria bacterium]
MRRPALLLLIAALALTPAAHADIPNPNQSTVDPCLVLCPAGDLTFHVVVRGFTGNPFAGSSVQIEYSACPGFHLCALTGGEPYTHLSLSGLEMVGVISDVQGMASFPVKAGGGCSSGAVKVYADGVLLANRALASPDQNGDGVVSAQDVTLLQAKLGTADPTGDLDCSGAVDGADLALLQAHAGHACAQPTEVRPGTWGRIKTLYR